MVGQMVLLPAMGALDLNSLIDYARMAGPGSSKPDLTG
jgi:hypothetical protein